MFVPKGRKKELYGKVRKFLGPVFHELAGQRRSQILEGHMVQDHVHMLIWIPPKYSVAEVVGYLKGKSAIAVARQFGGRKRNFNGVTHSEYNASDMDPLHFLQMWITPNQRSLTPGYQQKRFEPTTGVQLIASPDGRDGSLVIHQDTKLYHVVLESEQRTDYRVVPGRTLYLHVFRGALAVHDEHYTPGMAQP